MTYNEYRQKSGLTNKEIISLLRPHFPKFSKVQCSMLSHPEIYGVEISPKALKLLPPLPGKKAPAKRSKPNRLTVRLNDADYALVDALIRQNGGSAQSFLEEALKEKLETVK